jgi:hypothetical protein
VFGLYSSENLGGEIDIQTDQLERMNGKSENVNLSLQLGILGSSFEAHLTHLYLITNAGG